MSPSSVGLIIPQLVFGCCGLFLWGDHADFSHTLVLPVLPLAYSWWHVIGVAASLYIVDAHRSFVTTGCSMTDIVRRNCYRSFYLHSILRYVFPLMLLEEKLAD